MNDIWYAVLFFLPAGLANATPVFANKIPVLNSWKTPFDLGAHWQDQRLLGDNKTWRGVISGAIVAGVTGILLKKLFPEITAFSDINFFGFTLMGFGALLGDAVESFFKRRAGVKPGDSWFPFDQLDYIIGGLLIITPFADLSFKDYMGIAIVYFGLHLIASYIGYRVGLKKKPI